MPVRPFLLFRSARHREEATKLSAGLLNGVAIACLIGATFGPMLNADLGWNVAAFVLFIAAFAFHAIAQFVLSLGFRKDSPDV